MAFIRFIRKIAWLCLSTLEQDLICIILRSGQYICHSYCETHEKAVISLSILSVHVKAPHRKSLWIYRSYTCIYDSASMTTPGHENNKTQRDALYVGRLGGGRQSFCMVRRLSQPPPCSLAGWSTLTHSCCYCVRGYAWAKSTAQIKHGR